MDFCAELSGELGFLPAANNRPSSSTASASWVAVSGSTRTGPSLTSPSSIVRRRSGDNVPPLRDTLGSSIHVGRAGGGAKHQRPSRRDGYAVERENLAEGEKIPPYK